MVDRVGNDDADVLASATRMVVRSLVYDDANYMLHYDNDGDVNVKSVG